MSKENNPRRRAEKPEWVSGYRSIWNPLTTLAPEEYRPPRWLSIIAWFFFLLGPLFIDSNGHDLGLYPALRIGGLTSPMYISIPLATLLYIAGTYLGKFHAEGLALEKAYGPFEEAGDELSQRPFSWLSFGALKFWVRNQAEHIPPGWLVFIVWLLLIPVCLIVGFMHNLSDGNSVFLVVGCYVLGSLCGQSYSARQLMDEKYGS